VFVVHLWSNRLAERLPQTPHAFRHLKSALDKLWVDDSSNSEFAADHKPPNNSSVPTESPPPKNGNSRERGAWQAAVKVCHVHHTQHLLLLLLLLLLQRSAAA
jgi:hypothetical protein